MKLLTQPCVRKFFLCLLQMGKGNYSSVMQQISFIIQISAETLGSGTRASAPDPGSFKIGWHKGSKMHWGCWKERPWPHLLSLLNLGLVLSLTLYSDTPIAAAAAPKSHFRIGHSLLFSSSCEMGAKGIKLASSLVKPMKPLQKPLLNLVQGQFKGRSRENEANENKMNGKGQTEDGRWLSGCLGASQHGRPGSGLLFPLSSHSKLNKAIIKISVFPKHCKRIKQTDQNILGFFFGIAKRTH